MSATCSCGRTPAPLFDWYPDSDGFQRAVVFRVGYNCERRGGESHGVHGMEVHWCLRNAAGTAVFTICTDWVPGRLSPGHGLAPDGSWHRPGMYPIGADLGIHAKRSGGDRTRFESCAYVDGECFYDGRSLKARELVPRFIVRGEAVIWTALRDVLRALDAPID